MKTNREWLHSDIPLLFEAPPSGVPLAVAWQIQRRRESVDRYELSASSALCEYLDWPGLGNVCRMRRMARRKGQWATQTRYAITSLSAGAEELLATGRGHWGIENRLHWVRDVTPDEDASQIRTRGAPQVMAALHNGIIGALRLLGCRNIAASTRQIAWQNRALGLIDVHVPPKSKDPDGAPAVACRLPSRMLQ